jgi:hypothetical protein
VCASCDVEFRPAAHQRDFIDTYGFDVRDWEGFVVLHGIRDLKLITGVFPWVGSPPVVQAKFHRRMASLRADRRSERCRTPGAEATPRESVTRRGPTIWTYPFVLCTCVFIWMRAAMDPRP